MRLAQALVHFESLHGCLAGLEQSFLRGNRLHRGGPAIRLSQIRISLCVSRLQFDGSAEIHNRFFEAVWRNLRRIMAASDIGIVSFRVSRPQISQPRLFFWRECHADLTRN